MSPRLPDPGRVSGDRCFANMEHGGQTVLHCGLVGSTESSVSVSFSRWPINWSGVTGEESQRS